MRDTAYTLLVKSVEGDGYFYVRINLTGGEVEEEKVARIKDALNVARNMQQVKSEAGTCP
jgi:hypothetical protein